MSACIKSVDRLVIGCKNWGWKNAFKCIDWGEQRREECSEWKDEGYSQCSEWGQECGWEFWNCILEWVCYGWYWVANVVCQGWYWVVETVCVVGVILAVFGCLAFGWLLKPFCLLWNWFVCTIRAAGRWIASLVSSTTSPSAKVEHIFVLMLENRSFDHILGFRYAPATGTTSDGQGGSSGAAGGHGHGGSGQHGHPHSGHDEHSGEESGHKDEPVAGEPKLSCNAGFDPEVNNNEGVPVQIGAEFSLDGIDQDPGHEFPDVLTSLCGKGAVYNPVPGGYPPINNSGFVENYRNPGDPNDTPASQPQRIMKCFEPSRLPVINQLADEFAVCDNWFSSLPGPTWPNRFFAMAATSGGLDGSPQGWEIAAGTTIEGYRFENGTIFDLLDDACHDWRIFRGDDFPVSFALNGMDAYELQRRIRSFDDFASEVAEADFSDNYVFIEPKYGKHEFDALGPGNFVCGDSMHPLDDVTSGEALIKQVYEVIRNSPHWEKSLLIITFDEHGGFYDHVKPPAAVPPGDVQTAQYVQNNFLFDQLGVRVPALVISPYVPRGTCDHTVYDHGSIPATAERAFGMSALTSRDAAAKDVLSLLSLGAPRQDTPAVLKSPAINPKPLPCGDDTMAKSMQSWGELKAARESGTYRDRDVKEYKIKRSQIGFMQVALLRLLAVAEEPERSMWIDEYKKIETGVDAALFMTGAKLKLRHGVDVKRAEREHAKQQQQGAHLARMRDRRAELRNIRASRKARKRGGSGGAR